MTSAELMTTDSSLQECSCCPEHAERMRRMEERVRDLAVAVESFMTTVEPAMRMIGQPGGIASLLFKRK